MQHAWPNGAANNRAGGWSGRRLRAGPKQRTTTHQLYARALNIISCRVIMHVLTLDCLAIVYTATHPPLTLYAQAVFSSWCKDHIAIAASAVCGIVVKAMRQCVASHLGTTSDHHRHAVVPAMLMTACTLCRAVGTVQSPHCVPSYVAWALATITRGGIWTCPTPAWQL